MLLEAPLLDELLGRDVAGREEDGGGHALGKERASGESAVVPVTGVRQRSRRASEG